MTSIERAMEKLGGSDDAAEIESAPVKKADSSPESTGTVGPRPPTDGVAEAEANKAQPNSVPESDDQELRPEAAATADTETSPPPVAPVDVTSATVTKARLPAPDIQPNSANFVNIEFERLAAAGHLIPDASVITRASEEYQQIKRRLLGNLVEGVLNTPRPKNLIMVTSSLPSEGKTFTSVNLALSLTMEVDHTILAVDTDIVKRDLSRAFGVESYMGLYDLLGDKQYKVEDLLVRTSIPNLVILPAGQNRDASTERLASAQMRDLTDELASRYRDRVVLFDSPPILATTTATALAPLVGQLMIVVEAARTKQETVRDSLQRLEGIRVTGLVLNKSRQPATRAYDYYGYYYRPE